MIERDRTWVIVTADFPPSRGGIQRYCEALAGALTADGCDVRVIAPAAPGDAAFDARLCYPVTRVPGTGMRLVLPLRSALAREIAARDGNVHAVVAGWKPAGFAVASLVPFRRRFRATHLAFGSEIARQNTALRRLLLRITLARATRVVAISSFTARLVRRAAGIDADIVPVGVIAEPIASTPAAIPTILAVGRLVPRKGFDRLIEALALARNVLPNAELEIIGDGPQREELEALALRVGVADRTHFRGEIDDVALRDAYARAWCFAMPNRREGLDVEGFGIVFLEAAVAGLPAIGGIDSGAEDAIEHGVTGLLVDGRESSQICDALAQLLANPGLCAEMGRAARHRAIERFGWTSVARRLTSASAARKTRKSIRVAFIDQRGGSAGGAEESLALLLRHLPSRIEPLAVLFEDGAYADRLRGLGIDVAIHGIPESVKKATRERPRLRSALDIPRSAFELARVLGRERVDLVYTNTIKAHVVGGLAARIARVPGIGHLRDILEGSSLHLVRMALGTCSARRIAISRAVADAYGLAKTDVIPNPVDLAAYAALVPSDAARAALGITWDGPLVGIVGRINRWKGHDRFLRIARHVVDAVPAKFVIAGAALFRDADFEAELHDLVRELGLEAHVIFLPWQDDPRTVYRAIDLLCNCSTREPFGRTTIEAAAAGRPTVCFDDGGAAEAVQDGMTGRAVAPGDERAFADAVLGFVLHDDARAAAGERARRLAQRYRADLHAERVAATIERVSPGYEGSS